MICINILFCYLFKHIFKIKINFRTWFGRRGRKGDSGMVGISGIKGYRGQKGECGDDGLKGYFLRDTLLSILSEIFYFKVHLV